MAGIKKNGMIRGILIDLLIVMLFLTGCQKDGDEELHDFAVWEKTAEEDYQLSDGTLVSKWKNSAQDQYRYRLEDGTDLLETTDTLSPGEAENPEILGMKGLKEEVRQAVERYYQEQGLCYDLDQMLEEAYEDYLACKKTKERFLCHTVTQDITPTAETDRMLVLMTAVIEPKDPHFTGNTRTRYSSLIVDREEGTFLEIWELFDLPEKDVKKELAKLCSIEDNTVSEKDILPVMDQADILLFQDYLEVWFPYGTWEKQEFDKGFGFEYGQLENLLFEWAVPPHT